MEISVDGVKRDARRVEATASPAGQTVRFFRFLALSLALALLFFLGACLYEWRALGEFQLGMRKPPFVTAYYLGRFAIAALLSAAIVAGLYRLRVADAPIDRGTLAPPQRSVAFALLALAAACALLFIIDPRLFNRLSMEDRALEWISALLPLAASVGFFIAFIRLKRAPQRDLRRRLSLGFCIFLAVMLFVIGMEEISWMQRVFNIATPALFAENQQREMNFHNMHSIVIGQTYKIVMFVALVMLPFLVDTAPRNRMFDLLSDFLPSRFILAISAPWVAFNYNEWNFLASQLFVTLTLALLACYLKAAWDRREFGDSALYGASTLFILLAQPMFLVRGEHFVRMWDASEYVELFIAIGLVFYTAETMTRLAARYGAAGVPRR